MRIELHPEARRDFDEAFDWYAARSINAAANFAAEVDAAMKRIAAFPEHSARIDDRHRVTLLNRFPYHVVYRVTEEAIVVIALAHGARRPGFWRTR